MKKFFTLSAFIILICISQLNAQGWRHGEMEIKVEISNQSIADQIISLGLDGEFYPEGATLFVSPDEAQQLSDAGIDYEILKEDLNAYYKDFWLVPAGYHSYQEIVDLADSLATEFPNICSKVVFGTSMEGRELAALKISDNASTDENEAEILFDGGIHGDEIGGPENCIRFARDLCIKYGSDPDVTFLVDNREIWIYYMVNPDGRENMERYNANGVDCNRDYGFMWDAWGGSTGAFSQIETKNLRNCSYQNQFVVHTTYHGGTEYISCPWSYRPETPPDMAHILQLAELYSTESGYANLEFGQGNSGMYAINGSTKDGNYGAAGSISWSMEISYEKQPPASQIMQYYDWNYPSMMAMIEYAGYGLEGSITDAVSGDPVRATVFVNDYLQCFSDSTAGDFHKYVLPGKYMITVIANGYETQSSTDSVEVTELSSTISDFQMVAVDDARYYAWRMISSQIPGNNTVDEGNTKALIGPPDFIHYSIGKDGWVVVDMQKPIVDLPGNDIKVYESDLTAEGYSLYASQFMDGPWTILGEGLGTTEFELDGSGLAEARYFKILDDGNGQQNADDAGFDLDAISDMDHIIGVHILLDDYTLDDENGNGHLEQGETADLIVELWNIGNVTANDVEGSLSTSNPHISITQPTANYGSLASNQSGAGTFSFEVDEDIMTGDTVFFDIDVVANSGMYNNAYTLMFVVGKFPILIIDLDGNNSSGTIMQDIIGDLNLVSTYSTSFFNDLEMYEVVFVCLGVNGNNHVLSSSEGQDLANFLNHGGRLYMEGGNTWFDDPQTAVHPLFKISGLENGVNDLGIIFGQDGSFAEDLVYQYEGDNSNIDRIGPTGNAFELFRNQIPSYCNAVALDEGSYKTVGFSFEFGGLDDGQNTKEELMILILEFFGGILTDVSEPIQSQNEIYIHTWPNPFSDQLNISFTLENSTHVDVDIFDINGRKIKSITHGQMPIGEHTVSWDGTSSEGRNMPDGMYFYMLKTNNDQFSGKVLLNK